jgi:dolichyl-phosphate-mannose--protein O-mannosyl transferase
LGRVDHWNGLFLVSICLLWLASLFLRFWRLTWLEPPVFDEVYFPTFAEDYLDGTAPFDVHPPLGKYFIALGVLLEGRNALGYRIASAIAGSLIPVALAGLAYRLTHRRRFAAIAGLLMLSDGLFLVQSRFGLLDVFLVLFGLLAQVFLLAGLEQQGWRRTLSLSCMGILLGASASVKWNGLGFTLAILLVAVWMWGLAALRPQALAGSSRAGSSPGASSRLLAQLTLLKWWQYLWYFASIPLTVYLLQWVPHLLLDETVRNHGLAHFGAALNEVHIDMLRNQTNANVGVGTAERVHPYCSGWLTWPLLGRPVAYFFHAQGDVWQDVHALGNPLLWWMATAATLTMGLTALRRDQTLPLYLTLGFAANYLPWAGVSRCLFLYHYMSALTFSILSLAWMLDRLLQRSQRGWQLLAIHAIGLVLAAFWFFLPIWLGLPLTAEQFYRRIWFPPGRIPGFNWI